MSTVTGNFPVNEIDVKIDKSSTSNRSSTPSFVTIKDLESGGISVDTGVETWNPFDTKGWQRALATSKAINLSFSGKRNYGDEGNDYVANKWMKNGQACNSTIQLTFPDGTKVQVPCVIQVTNPGGGDSTNVMPLEWEAVSDGRPTVTGPTGSEITLDGNDEFELEDDEDEDGDGENNGGDA